MIAENDVADRYGEEADAERQHGQIHHVSPRYEER
jgi:hypothetical protein